MGLRVCLVTPFAWSRPHDVNEHVAGVARELRLLGHQVTVLAPSTRATDLIEGRRALLDGDGAEVIALGPALPVSRRSRIGVPLGVRANLSLALARGEYGRAACLPTVHGNRYRGLNLHSARQFKQYAVTRKKLCHVLGFHVGAVAT